MKDRKNKNHFEPRAKWIKTINLIMAARQHHNTSLTCEAQNSAESVPQSTEMKLLVEFAPSVRLERSPAVLREGDTAIFKCLAEANPANLSYRWFLGGREMEGGEDGSVLVLPGLNRTSAGQIVKCQVRNYIGKSEETYSLQIYCESITRLVGKALKKNGNVQTIQWIFVGRLSPQTQSPNFFLSILKFSLNISTKRRA